MVFNLPSIKSNSELKNNLNKQSSIDDIFNNFFNDVISFFPSRSNHEHSLPIRCDICEDDSGYNLEIELPGVDQNCVDLKIDSNVLTIKGYKENITDNKDKNYHVQERYYGSFLRSISLPSNIDTEGIEAKFSNGVLYITIPKKEPNKAKRIDIKIDKK